MASSLPQTVLGCSTAELIVAETWLKSALEAGSSSKLLKSPGLFLPGTHAGYMNYLVLLVVDAFDREERLLLDIVDYRFSIARFFLASKFSFGIFGCITDYLYPLLSRSFAFSFSVLTVAAYLI